MIFEALSRLRSLFIKSRSVQGFFSSLFFSFSLFFFFLVYFIFIEQSVVCSTKSFTKALFLWFSFYYIFNLEYEKNSRDLCLFFQEFVFGLPDHLCKKSSTCISVSTAVE